MSLNVDRLVVTPYSQKVIPVTSLSGRPPSGRVKSGKCIPVLSSQNGENEGLTVRKITTRKEGRPTYVQTASSQRNEEKVDLSSINAQIDEQITRNFSEIKKFFQVYDRDETFYVTRSDFKTVLREGMNVKLSEAQFNQLYQSPAVKSLRNKAGCVNYIEFMQQRFDKTCMEKSDSWLQLMSKRTRAQSPQPEVGLEKIERSLREKITLNLANIMRAFHLFDYNRDDHIQKHEMRKILENFCFRMTDNQFDRLWSRYDLTRSGVTNYKDFLQRLGVDLTQKTPNGQQISSRPSQRPTSASASRSLAASFVSERGGSLRMRPSSADQVTSRGQQGQANQGGHGESGKNLFEIEREFRRLMRANYEQIRKTCEAFDPQRENKLTIESMHNILNRFTVPMSESLFNLILTRCGLKATGVITWIQFLEHFQQPFQFSKTANSLPVKQTSHQVYPHKFSHEEQLSATDIIHLIHNHVNKNYQSLKNAFLAFDPERKGKIFRKELRRIIESFCMKLTDSQFKELIILLDPKHQGFVDYHQFLTLFEMPDNVDWFKAEDSRDQVEKIGAKLAEDPNVAFATAEDIIREKFITNGNDLAKDVVRNPEYFKELTKDAMRHLITKHALPISDTHLDRLWGKMALGSSGKVSFEEFMRVMGLQPDTGDTSGLSTLISMENDRFLEERQVDHESRLHSLAMNTMKRTDRMSLDELIKEIRENIYRKHSDIRKEFMRYDGDQDAKVTKPELKKILMSSFGIDLDPATFENLCIALKFPATGLSYVDFLRAFQQDGTDGQSGFQRTAAKSNHTKKELPEEDSQDAESVHSQLKSKILNHHQTLREAFYKGDHGKKGYWDRNDFRRLLDKHMFFVDNEQFDRLMHMIGVSHKGKVTYKQFVELFQESSFHGDAQYQDSSHCETLVVPKSPAHLAAEQVYDILKLKAASRYPDLTRAFQVLEKDSQGRITKAEFRRLLWKFNLPIGNDEFDRLWFMYDQEGEESVSFDKFTKLMGLVFSGNDKEGFSSNIIDQNTQTVNAHIEGQIMRQMDVTEKQMQASQNAEKIEQQLRDSFTDNFSTFFRAFRNADVTHDGYISTDQLYNILLRHNYVMDSDTFTKVLERLGLPVNTRRINYERFLKVIDSTKQQKFIPKTEDELLKEAEARRRLRFEIGEIDEETGSLKKMRTDNWSVNKIVDELTKQVTKIAKDLLKAFQSFDVQDCGRIKATDFRRVLETFCFPLKDSQFKGLIQTLYLYQDLTISYLQFLDNYVMIEDSSPQSNRHKFSEMIRIQTPKPREGGMPFEEVLQRLREIVTARFYHFAEALKKIDYAQLGVVTQQDFREVLQKLALRVSDEQFEQLMSKVITDQGGNVDYHDFLREFSSEAYIPTPPTSFSPPPGDYQQSQTMPRMMEPSQKPEEISLNLNLKTSRSRPKSALSSAVHRTTERHLNYLTTRNLVDADDVETKLQMKMKKNWKSFQKFCRTMDYENSGTISVHQFTKFLDKIAAVELTDDEVSILVSKFMAENQRFDYHRFLKHFVISKEIEGVTTRPKTSMDHRFSRDEEGFNEVSPVAVGRQQLLSSEVQNVIEKLRPKVESDWKTMRRELKRHDKKNSAKVHVDVLKQVFFSHNFNLSEEEFFHLVSHCDGKMSGMINYNDLFRIILK